MSVDIEVLLNIVQIIIMVVILITVTKMRVQLGIQPLNLIMLMVFLFICRSVAYVSVIDTRNEFNAADEFQFVFLHLAFFTLYIFAELTLDERPNSIRLSIFAILSGSFYVLFIKGLIDEVSHPNILFDSSREYPVWQIPLDLISIGVTGFAVYVSMKLYLLSKSRKNVISNGLLLIAFVSFLIANILEVMEWIIGISVSRTIAYTPGFVLLIGLYLYNPRFAFMTPIKIERLIVLHELGHPLLDFQSTQDDNEEVGNALMVGNVLAYFNFAFQDIIQDKVTIKKTAIGQTNLLYQKSGKIYTLIETKKSTYTLRKALISFTNDFEKLYRPILKDWHGGSIDTFKIFEDEVKTYFPFIDE